MNPAERNDFFTVAVEAAKLAGRIILDNLGRISKEDIGIKQTSDFVTRVDKESERTHYKNYKGEFPRSSLSCGRVRERN